jgi:hypothetical protein
MPVSYCSIIAKHEKVLLAESTLHESMDWRVKKLCDTILHGKSSDGIEIENNQILAYSRTKKVILICIAGKGEQNKIKRFMEQLVGELIKEFGSLDGILTKDVHRLCIQTRVELKLNKLINEINTGLYEGRDLIHGMTDDLVEIRHELHENINKVVKSNENLDELLITSKKIKIGAHEYKENAKELEVQTRCLKPWMVYMLISCLILFIVYTVFALIRCGSMSLFCD